MMSLRVSLITLLSCLFCQMAQADVRPLIVVQTLNPPASPVFTTWGQDVAIDGATITAVGTVSGRGRREIDARGQLVTPGFVDIHTHYDAQVTWDPLLTPSSWHGCTTVVMGSCGVGFDIVLDQVFALQQRPIALDRRMVHHRHGQALRRFAGAIAVPAKA